MVAIGGRPVLIATLGTQPQVVTLAVDLLAEDEHVEVEEVYVIHTAPVGRVGEAVATLRDAFSGGKYQQRRCHLTCVEIVDEQKQPVQDIRTEHDARAAFYAIFRTVRERKQAHETVHLSIAGGRNSMVVYGAATAQILFDSSDKLWHIISTEAFEQQHALHRMRRGDARLSAVPVIAWSAWLNHAIAMWTEDPLVAFETQSSLAEQQRDRECADFLEQLNDSQWRTLVAYIHTTRGGTNQQIAETLFLARRTIEGCFRVIYGMMMNYRDLPEKEIDPHAKRALLMHWFGDFFDRHPELREPPDLRHSPL